MKNKLDVPPELNHLIEKREDGERRKNDATASGDNAATGDGREGTAKKPLMERRRGDRRSS